MKPPKRLQVLLDEGLVDQVLRQLMSCKGAKVYVVRCGGEVRCAKVYKDASERSFRQAVDYTENRKIKNSRQARAMAKGTRYGLQAAEPAWQSAEVDALYRLAGAVVRVSRPNNFFEGVLLMELVTDAEGAAAPHLNDCLFSPAGVARHHATLPHAVAYLRAFFGRFAPELWATDYDPEIWSLYRQGLLTPDAVLTGRFERPERQWKWAA